MVAGPWVSSGTSGTGPGRVYLQSMARAGIPTEHGQDQYSRARASISQGPPLSNGNLTNDEANAIIDESVPI